MGCLRSLLPAQGSNYLYVSNRASIKRIPMLVFHCKLKTVASVVLFLQWRSEVNFDVHLQKKVAECAPVSSRNLVVPAITPQKLKVSASKLCCLSLKLRI